MVWVYILRVLLTLKVLKLLYSIVYISCLEQSKKFGVARTINMQEFENKELVLKKYCVI